MSSSGMPSSMACEVGVRVSKLEKDLNSIRERLRYNDNSYTNQVFRCLKRFLRYRQKHKNTETHIQMFAFNLYCSKPRIYKHLKGILDLPDEGVFQNFKMNLTPVFEESTLYFLSSKLNSFKHEMNHFVLCIDQIKLNRNFTYDTKRDSFLGFHNVDGTYMTISATTAYVLLLRNIKMNWALPIAYALVCDSAVSEQQVAAWCVKVVKLLTQIGVKVHALITKLHTILSKKSQLLLSIQRYLRQLPSSKIYELHDARLGIEAVRDCLIKNDLYLNGSRVSWHYIKLLYYQQKDCAEPALIPEITEKHIHPGSQLRSHFRFSSQIFSLSVYNAFNDLITSGALPQEAQATADFVKIMSELLEVAHYSPRTGRQNIDIDEQIEVLLTTLNIFYNIKGENNVPLEIIHMQETINVMVHLLQDLRKYRLKRVYTARLNGAPLETFFRNIPRATKEGRRLRPTAGRLGAAFSAAFCRGVRRRVGRAARRERLADAARGVLDVRRAPPAPPASPLRLPFPARAYRIQLPVKNSELYIASFLLYKCMQVHCCQELKDSLWPPVYLHISQKSFRMFNPSEEFYEKLLVPPPAFVQYVENISLELLVHLRQSLTRAPGAAAWRQLARAPPAALPCACFPARLLRALFVRLRLWAILKNNNARLRHHSVNGTLNLRNSSFQFFRNFSRNK